MSKIAIGLVGGVALAAAAVVGGAAWSGQVAQQRLEADMTAWLATLPVKVTQSTYEKTLFSATQTVVLVPGCEESDTDEAQAKSITLRQHIQHGPLPGFTRVGWTVVDSELLMPAPLRDLLQNPSEDQALVSAHTEIGLFGGFRARITTPTLEFKEDPAHPGKAVVQGVELQLRGSSLSSGTLSYDLVWPGLVGSGSTDTGDTRVQVGRLTVHGDGLYDAHDLLRLTVGKTTSDLALVEVSNTPKGLGKPTNLVFRDIKGGSEATLENQDLLNRVSTLTAQGEINGQKISKFDMRASLKRLHLPSYALMLQKAWSPSVLCEEQEHPEDLAGQAQATMGAMLPYNPEVSVDKLEIEMDGQTATLSYVVGTQGITAEEAASPELPSVLMAKTRASGEVKVPMAWIEKAMIDSQPQRQAQDKAMLEAMVGQAVDNGYVVREGVLLASQFKLEQGSLLVNGKPLK
jgi:uncharacterized protein YdgA (DUF945 family)